MTSSTIPAVRHVVTVNATAQRAFDVFIGSMTTWFPHRIGEEKGADVVVEPRVGGRWYERGATTGAECDWGRVLVHEPPHRLVLAWHLDGTWRFDPDPARASEIEITFTAEAPDRTRVELDHHDFERHGATGSDLQQSVSAGNGWGAILAGYAEVVSG